MELLDHRLAHRRLHPALWVVVAVMVGIELAFSASDAGFLGTAFSRYRIYDRFAYFDVLFERAVQTGEVAPQLVWSLLTHAALHGGWLHLVMNAVIFLALGHAVSQTVGIRATAAIVAVTAASGALTFSLFTDTPWPLVGASGVVFGFFGVITAWQERTLRQAGRDRSPIWGRIGGLAAINVVMHFGLGGVIAWEAHLGGFVAGWAMAYVTGPRRARWARPRA